MTPEQLANIQARADAATEGPWETTRAGMLGTRVVHVDGEWDGLVPDEFITMVTPALRKYDDANFIAAARTDVPALLALVREQAAKLERVLQLHPRTCDISGDSCEAVSDPSMKCTMLVCGPCGDVWPCPTIAALTETEGAA